MDTSPRFASPAEAFKRAISLAGSEEKLAELIGCTQPAVNKAKRKDHVSAEMAAAVHNVLSPDVTKTDLRPDLWPAEERATEVA